MTRLAWGSATDTGRVRQNNQDSVLTSGTLFAVADGMGGHQAGEVASELALAALTEAIHEPTTEALVRAVQVANDRVVSTAIGDPDLAGMGTTLCAMCVVDVGGQERLAIVNVGDSRVYLLKEGHLAQVTDDHSLVATLERQGRLTPAEAAVHPQRNIVTRALGIDTRVMVDSWEVLPVPGDRYILCSDGLSNEVDENKMAATLRRLEEPSDAAHELVRLANEAGGRDNISVVVVDVMADDGAANGPGRDDERVLSAVAGEERAIDSVGLADASDASDASEGPDPASRRSGGLALTWRTAAFVAAVLAVFGIGFAAVDYYGRNTFYVGFRDNVVVIYRGKPGGVLWIQPDVVERTDLTRQGVPASAVSGLDKGKVEPTLADAHRYVKNLRDQRASTQPTTPSTPSATNATATTAGN